MRLCYASCAALANSLTKKAPYKGLGADSEEKREPVSDIDTVAVDSLKALDPNPPIREADMPGGPSMAVHQLHAQAKPPAFLVFETEVKDRDACHA